jgi:hypothetical protein
MHPLPACNSAIALQYPPRFGESLSIGDRFGQLTALWNHAMPDNPYAAPQAPPRNRQRFEWIRLLVAVVLLAFGLLIGFGAARHFILLFSGPGPGREIAAFGFPAIATAAAGFMTSAIAVARGRSWLAAAGAAIVFVGIGGWYLFLYAVTAGWFQ